jgi:hypothetical protein
MKMSLFINMCEFPIYTFSGSLQSPHFLSLENSYSGELCHY